MSIVELKEAIFQNSSNEDAWLALSDFLTSQEDIRGELISLELSGGSERVEEIYAKNKASWCGEELYSMIEKASADEDSALKIEWKFGYIWSVRLHSFYDYSGPSMTEILDGILNSSAGEYIHEIKAGILEDEENNYDELIDILKKRAIPSLKHLHLGDFEYPDDTEISWSYVNNVEALWSIAPNLEKLRLTGADIDLGTLKHNKLKSLSLETGGLPTAPIKSVMSADLPELTELEMWFGDENYGAEGDASMLEPLLKGGLFPKLNKLGLKNSEFQDAIVEAIASSQVLKSIQTLDLSMGIMLDKGAQFLIDNYEQFKHLDSVNVSQNFIGSDVCKKLTDLYGSKIDVSDQDDDLEYLYVSVSE